MSTRDSVPSLHHVVEHTLRPIESSKKTSGESCSTKPVPLSSTKMRKQMTQSKNSLVVLLDSLVLTAQKRLHTTISRVLQTLHTILRGHPRHYYSYRKHRSFLTIKRPCLCSSRIFRWHSLLMGLTVCLRAKHMWTYSSLCKPYHLLSSSTSLGTCRQYPLQVHLWLCHRKQPIAVHQGQCRQS